MKSHLPNCPESKKYGLAIHTSTPELGFALNNFAGDSRCCCWNLGRSLSALMHQYLVEFLAPQTWEDLAFVAVANGPGGFTGTRIGVVTARTLSQQLDIPLFAVSTLASVAWAYYQDRLNHSFEDAIAVQMPAQRSQVFTAIYQITASGSRLTKSSRSMETVSSVPCSVTPLLLDTVMTIEAWQQTLKNLSIPYHLIQVPSELGTSASSLLTLADLDWQQGKRPHWSETLPFYGQHPVEG